MTVIPYIAALLAALLNTTGDLLQRRSTRSTPSEEAGSYRLFLDLFHRPGWLLGLLASIVGLGVHIVALSLGEIATVQPLLVLELPLAVLGAGWLFGVHLSRRDWFAVAVLAVGLAAFVFFLHPTGGRPSAVPGTTWALGLAVLAVLVAGLALTLGNPLVAVIWGLLVFGEQARTGAWLVGTGAGAILLVVGILLLSRSPVLDAGSGHGSHGDDHTRAQART